MDFSEEDGRLGRGLGFFVARLVPSLLGIVTTAALTRMLDPADYGLYALGLSGVFFVTTGAFEWIGLSLLRIAPTADRPELFYGTLMTCFCTLLGLCFAAGLIVYALGGLRGYGAFACACGGMATASAWTELKQRLQMAELRARAYLLTGLIRGLATMLLVTTAAWWSHSATALLVASGAGVLCAGLVDRDPRLGFGRLRFDPALCRELLRYGLPLSISVGLATLLMCLDKWLLQALDTPEAVGLFSAAALIAQVPVLTLASCIGPSAYSTAVRAVEFASPAAVERQLIQNFTILLAMTLPSAVGVVALSANIVEVITGPAYHDAVVRLAPWLGAAAVAAGMRAFYLDLAFQLARRPMGLIWTMLLTIAVNGGLDLWLIPIRHEEGAAIGGFAALCVSLVSAAILGRRVYRLPFPVKEAAKIAASAGVMLLALRQIPQSGGPVALLIQIGAGASAYAACLLASNVAGLRDWTTAEVPQLRRLMGLTR